MRQELPPHSSQSAALTGLLPGWQQAALAQSPYLIGVLPGEGVGPEVVGASLRLLQTIKACTAHRFEIRHGGSIGLDAQLATGRALRLLGEDLVLFRTGGGQLGLIDERCTHRQTSLRGGRVDEVGISCPHHGWKFDPGGLIFAYLGPELQIMENSVDPIHVEWLHGHHLTEVRRGMGQAAPTHYAKRHSKIGFDFFRYGIIKRRVLEGGSEDDDDWIVGHPLIFPAMLRVGAGAQHRFQIRVPVDDTHTLHFWYSCYLPQPGRVLREQAEVPVYEVPWQDEQGNFIVDFVDGGDIMTWVSQGPIADRTRELLVASDRGITLLRRLLGDA